MKFWANIADFEFRKILMAAPPSNDGFGFGGEPAKNRGPTQNTVYSMVMAGKKTATGAVEETGPDPGRCNGWARRLRPSGIFPAMRCFVCRIRPPDTVPWHIACHYSMCHDTHSFRSPQFPRSASQYYNFLK
jgi:hypothetical protein